jgi:DNA-binding transcriptional LysR family regulator
LIEYFAPRTVSSQHIHWEDIVEGNFEEWNVRHLVFPDALQAHYAAVHGQGIIIAPMYACDALVELGELARLGDQIFEYSNCFYFVLPKQQRVNPALYEFRDWLEEISSPYQ